VHILLVTGILYIILLARLLISKLLYSFDHRFPQTRMLDQSYIPYFVIYHYCLFYIVSLVI
jgi:hypothetical protein